MAAKIFVIEEPKIKSCNFRVMDLYIFLDAKFDEKSGEVKEYPDLIRSETSARDVLLTF